MVLRPDTALQFLKGVGPKLGDLFGRKGLKTVQDLLEFYPRAYEDRRVARDIASLVPEDLVSLKAQVVKVSSISLGRSSRKMYDVVLADRSGRISCKFFRVPYRGYFDRFTPGKTVRVIGKVLQYRGRIEFHHPEIQDYEDGLQIEDSISPIYVEIEGLSSTRIQKLIQLAISSLASLPDPLATEMRQKYDLISYQEALTFIHQPPKGAGREYLEQKSPAHRRIIFEEFFWFELFLAKNRFAVEKISADKIVHGGRKVQQLIKALPFSLTSAQSRAFSEIVGDFQSGHPMHRLVQGDVGCGKTLVALLAALHAVEGGKQACIMAPTEILAEQHLKNAKRLLDPLGVRTEMLSGKTKTKERNEILKELAAGKIDLLIGTHALIEPDVIFAKLALSVIDEQHRFGVEQRGKLKKKSQIPNLLVMTATPIPRTLALTVYGDLDVSVIDEMPPGRTPIQTRVISGNKRPQALQFMIEQVKKGRQVYIVYPLVEESEKIDLKNAMAEYQQLQEQYPEVKFDLLHGRMKAEEKETVMDNFRLGKTQVLVSTTVIEVGVDVANANMMIVEHAERFGLAQLHQLRGRVGRGSQKSFCIFILGYAVSEEGRQRIQFMENNSDGFKIAEFDLELRGPGEFLGTKQSGLPGFRMAHIVRDAPILFEARQAAFDLLRSNPHSNLLSHPTLGADRLLV